MIKNETDIDVAGLIGQEEGNSAEVNKAELEKQLQEKLLQLSQLKHTHSMEHATLQLDIAEILTALDRKEKAWTLAREAFETALKNESWQEAVEACNVLYQAEQPESIPALGMGVWLAVTFPINPELTYAMLDHVVDETPKHADGAALAAVTARYVIDIRADDAKHEGQSQLANHLIARVAERHSNVQDQQALNAWMDKLELRDPQVFLPRLSMVIGAIVGDTWWFDRNAIRSKLPD
ncbi:hypothetical protein [Sulfurirhabdus autotrophica]|uniref:Tetratricopeptide repeat protein n=1 Tax=Sulfurirhabdus autotrophica TaxID=1706046 RepID=A0A4V2W338_9PROT|nr:hypothetical protein [Sulfurirhabdus autotrophica]TCV90459.1 hypothetical protein EDC63_101432 [Sulfurirhabdus autotrophica]